MNLLIIFVLLFILSLLSTGFLRIYALKNRMIDIPNYRSSHTVPTPRGGGIAIVICFLLSVIFSGYYNLLSLPVSSLLFVSGFMVALVGWLDDHGHVNARWRLLVHFTASGMIVIVLGGLPILSFFELDIDFGLLGYPVATVGVVWMLNLYNFMDGIDGLASVQAVISSVVLGCILYFLYKQNGLAEVHWFLSVSVLGFLVWNLPPAKIFMGDAGSGFLGFMLAGLLLMSSQIDQSLFWAWLIMLGVFIVDSTYTLFRRLANGAKVYEAHRTHAYQYATRHFGNHRFVTFAVIAINIIWLAPIAYFVACYKLDGLLGLLIAYTPLLLLAYKFKAGTKEEIK
ncbi:MAG: hypothetical protein OFPI_27300 [Osedax symbiont Rs2]|nr:MAG: hypothetical protein OFPI_27300 [Osedax symbiont Rs2]